MLARFRTTKVYERMVRYEAVHQFVKYAMVGVVNVAIHLGLLNVFLLLHGNEVLANATAFLLTSINSFFLNRNWTFRDPRRHAVVRHYLQFVFFTLVGLALNTAAFKLFLVPLGRYGTLGTNLAALASVPVSVVWNFTSYRLWTFKQARPGSAPV